MLPFCIAAWSEADVAPCFVLPTDKHVPGVYAVRYALPFFIERSRRLTGVFLLFTDACRVTGQLPAEIVYDLEGRGIAVHSREMDD